MKIATWNVNGIRARQAQALEWLARERPDVVCLQELKAAPEQVPCRQEDPILKHGVASPTRCIVVQPAQVTSNPPRDVETVRKIIAGGLKTTFVEGSENLVRVIRLRGGLDDLDVALLELRHLREIAVSGGPVHELGIAQPLGLDNLHPGDADPIDERICPPLVQERFPQHFGLSRPEVPRVGTGHQLQRQNSRQDVDIVRQIDVGGIRSNNGVGNAHVSPA